MNTTEDNFYTHLHNKESLHTNLLQSSILQDLPAVQLRNSKLQVQPLLASFFSSSLLVFDSLKSNDQIVCIILFEIRKKRLEGVSESFCLKLQAYGIFRRKLGLSIFDTFGHYLRHSLLKIYQNGSDSVSRKIGMLFNVA